MLGIITALPIEARCLSLQSHSPALLSVSGMGADNARQAATQLIHQGATALVSFGTAVGLAPFIKPGTLCLPSVIVDAVGEACFVDAAWHLAMGQSLKKSLTVTTEKMAHAEDILATRQQKQSLHQKTTAIAADMESLAIGHVAAQMNLPFLIVRAVVDPAYFEMMPEWLSCFSMQDGISIKKLLRSCWRHPGYVMPLSRLACYFLQARWTLKQAAISIT